MVKKKVGEVSADVLKGIDKLNTRLDNLESNGSPAEPKHEDKHKQNYGHMAYCPDCGDEYSDKPEVPNEMVDECEDCNATVGKDEKFCWNCGDGLNEVNKDAR